MGSEEKITPQDLIDKIHAILTEVGRIHTILPAITESPKDKDTDNAHHPKAGLG